MMTRSLTLWIHPSLLLDLSLQTQNIVFNITNNFKQPKGEPSALDTTCWKKRVISPLKHNPNRPTQQIVLNKQSGIIKEIKRKKHIRKLLTEFGQFSLISEHKQKQLTFIIMGEDITNWNI